MLPPLPPWLPLAIFFFLISLNNTEILIIMFESHISNNKENKNVAPLPPWTPLAKKYFFEFL